MGYSPQGHKESDSAERLHFHFCVYCKCKFVTVKFSKMTHCKISHFCKGPPQRSTLSTTRYKEEHILEEIIPTELKKKKKTKNPTRKFRVCSSRGKNSKIWSICHRCSLPLHISSVQFSRLVVSDSLRPHESQHTRPPCPSPTPGVHPDSCPLSQ